MRFVGSQLRGRAKTNSARIQVVSCFLSMAWLLFNAAGLRAQTPTTWNGSVNTTYNNSANWSNGIANGNFSATIPGTGTATNQPTLTGSDTVSVLNLTSATSSLTIADNSTLLANTNAVTGAGTINNTGTLSLSSAGNTTQLQMTGGVGTVTLSGTGTLSLGNSTANLITSANSGSIFSNSSNITGAGAFTDAPGGDQAYALTNSGIITATGSAGLLINPGGGVTNTGTLQATSGTLNLQSGSVTNTGGFIVANAGGTVELTSGVSVSGGTLTNSGGTLQTLGTNSATLSGVTLSAGQFTVVDNSTLLLTGGNTLTNNGTVAMSSVGNTTRLEMTGSGMVTLSGTGAVTMTDNANNQIVAGNTGMTLINGASSTIQGAGTFTSSPAGTQNYTLQNNGTITASGTNALIVNPGGVTNTSTMQAGNGTLTGTLTLTGDTFTNTGGLILANTGSTVNLTGGATIVGGTLQNLGSGVLTTVGTSNATVNGVTIHSASTLKVADNSSLFLTGGSTLTNNGTLAINSAGNTTRLQMTGTNATVTLAGTGMIAMSDNANNQIVADNTGMTLINGASNTIQGAGTFTSAPGGTQAYTLQNNGTITALGTNALIVNPGGGVTNTATMQAGNGTAPGTLTLTGDTFTNTGGLILANTGSTVNLTGGATIVGGTLKNLGTGVLTTVGTSSATVNGVTIQSASTLNVADNSSLFLTGGSTLTNNGTLAVNSAGNTTRLQMTGTNTTVTLAGTGTITMTDNPGNQIVADNTGMTLINGAHNTIQGAGTFTSSPGGTQNYTLQNNGTITALGTNALIVNPGGGVTNTSTMQAGNGTTTGTLTLTGDTFTNTGGLILANTGSQVNLTGGATIVGGTLQNVGSGVLTTVGTSSATVNGVTVQGSSTLNVADNSSLFLTGGSTLTVNGTLAVNSAGNTTRLQMYGTGDTVTLAGTGAVTMSNFPSNQIVADNTGMTLVNGVNNTIQGAGAFTASPGGTQNYTVTNNGTITANASNGLVVNPGGTVNNTGTIQATSGGTLIFENNLYSQTGSGTIYANGGNVDLYNGTSITGGTLQTSGSSLIQTIGTQTALFSGSLTITGGSNVQVSDNSTLQLAGGNTFTNNGNINLNSAGNTTRLTLVGSGTVKLSGTGSLTSSNTPDNQIVANATGLALTNDVNHTISGSEVFTSSPGGTQNYDLTNNGTLLANQSNAMQIQPGGSVTNNGIMQADSGSVLHLESTNGTTFTNFSGDTLTGGTYNAYNGTIQIDQLGTTGGEIVNNAATILLSGTNSFISDQNNLDALTALASNSGSFSILNGRDINTPGEFTNSGTVDIGSTSSFDVNDGESLYLQTAGTTMVDGTLGSGITDIAGGFLEGVGTVLNGVEVSGGTVAPGDPPGTLTIDGYYNVVSGDLLIGLAGTSLYDALDVNGAANLGGTLEFDLQDGFTVASGDTFYIAEYDSRDGSTFNTIDYSGLDLAAGLTASVLYDKGAGDNEVELLISGTSSATPEPSTWLMFAGGLGALAAFQIARRRRKCA
jgi:hypothetical protein